MNIKKIANTVLLFTINRLIEILAIGVFIIGILLLIALLSYSPNDPNFIFPENTEIQNVLGFQGSYISDLFFQSVGIISYLMSVTLIVTGINISKSKDLFLVIENNSLNLSGKASKDGVTNNVATVANDNPNTIAHAKG